MVLTYRSLWPMGSHIEQGSTLCCIEQAWEPVSAPVLPFAFKFASLSSPLGSRVTTHILGPQLLATASGRIYQAV